MKRIMILALCLLWAGVNFGQQADDVYAILKVKGKVKTASDGFELFMGNKVKSTATVKFKDAQSMAVAVSSTNGRVNIAPTGEKLEVIVRDATSSPEKKIYEGTAIKNAKQATEILTSQDYILLRKRSVKLGSEFKLGSSERYILKYSTYSDSEVRIGLENKKGEIFLDASTVFKPEGSDKEYSAFECFDFQLQIENTETKEARPISLVNLVVPSSKTLKKEIETLAKYVFASTLRSEAYAFAVQAYGNVDKADFEQWFDAQTFK